MIRAVHASESSVSERISAAEDALAEAGAEVIPLQAGRVIRHRAFPHVYDANLVRRARLRPEALDQALRGLEAPFREVGARHLQLALDGADVPPAVRPLLVRRGFACDRLVAMTLSGPVALPRARGVRLRAVPDEVRWEEFARTMDLMNREEPGYAPGVSAEIVGALRGRAEAGAARLFVAESAGQAAGTVGLAMHRGAAAIFSVGTLPTKRRHGIGRTLVADAVGRARALGADLVYLIARADDRPRGLYERLGFRVALRFEVWLRAPSAADPPGSP